MKILIADSSIPIIDRLERLVLEAGNNLQICKAITFEEALQILEEYQPEVVLLDMNMPGNKSFDLLRQIKERNCNTAVISLSIHPMVNGMENCKELGADYFLDKYNEFDKIPDIINSIAEKEKLLVKN